MSSAITLYWNTVVQIWAFMVSNYIFNVAMILIIINLTVYFFKKLKHIL